MFDIHVFVIGVGAWQETVHGNAFGEAGVPSPERYDSLNYLQISDRSGNELVCKRTLNRLKKIDPREIGTRFKHDKVLFR